MLGPAAHAASADLAARARAALDESAAAVARAEEARRAAVASLVALWPTSAWLAAGCRSATLWLAHATDLSHHDARQLVAVAELCTRGPALADAVAEGRLPLGRAGVLARAVTDERAPRCTPAVVDALLRLCDDGADDLAFAAAVRFWAERVDEELRPRRVLPHSLVLSRRLFGGGEVHASLSPSAFETVAAALDAFTQDPDPADAPHRRTLSERRADALDDLAHHGLTHRCDVGGDASDDDCDVTSEHADLPDDLDVGLAHLAEHATVPDPLTAARERIRRQEVFRRRRRHRQVRARSGVTANVHIDLRTLSGARALDDVDGLVLRGEGWDLAHRAAERLLCDTALVATLFSGRREVLDANTAAERFSMAQRRALAARDGGCTFPGCRRPPRHCDAHHLEFRVHGGPTTVANGALVCRFHHRLVHDHGWSLTHDGSDWVATDPHGTEWRHRPGDQDAA